MFTYTNGKQQPVIKKTWAKGKQIKEEAWQEDGTLIRSITSNGPCIEYYEDGKKQMEYSKKNEEYDGAYSSWYPNGQLEVSTTYKNGKEKGKHIEYFSTGKIELEATYVNGKMSGSVMLYFDNGKERKKINYDLTAFNLIEEKEYSSARKIKFERTRIHDTQYMSMIYDSVSGTSN
jgi:antitoxin component YwqK of YwqJK toxin-antitoxin module